MQILPGDLRTGAIVRVRRARWRIADIRAYERCQVLTLTALSTPHGSTRRVIAPFDRVEAINAPRRPRISSARAWRRTFRALVARDCPPGGLRTATRARIDLLPYQLEPAMAIVRGEASRLLLADEVGLGKTIQAGLVIAELVERRAADRVLVLTPAGLRDQWRDELAGRFSIDATIVDARALGRAAARLPPDINPWTTIPIAIASIELVKRPEVLAAAAAARWDLVVLDEAHGAAGPSDRHAAAAALAGRAAYVLLISATPHNGDQAAYESLKSLGSTGDAPIVFRRTRRDVGFDVGRRVHIMRVRRTTDERRMDAALADYSAAIRRERADSCLALSVLHKRALSSAWSLGQSVGRRLSALPADPSPADDQLRLPLADGDGECSPGDQAPAWPSGLSLSDAALEQRLLESLADAAARAARRESKIGAVLRLIRRTGERVIVFTEYRDTLEHLRDAVGTRAVAVHGGMSREERAQALARFRLEPRAVLLATDAAGEGLNLHDAGRSVVNLELPWNPVRLEQRIGRVDRIGQRRRVHAWHLIAASTGETRILDRLRSRVAAAQAALGSPDPLGLPDDERTIAKLVVAGEEPPPVAADVPVFECRRGVDGRAIEEALRIHARRSFHAGTAGDQRTAGPLMLVARSRLRRRIGPGLLSVWTVAAEDSAGCAIECQVVPVRMYTASAYRRWTRARLTALLDAFADEIRARITVATEPWREAAARIDAAFRSTRLARERAIADRIASVSAGPYQTGLFDRRAERARIAVARTETAAAEAAGARIEALDRPIAVWSIHLALVAVSR